MKSYPEDPKVGVCERDHASAPGLSGVATSSGEGVPLSGIAAGRDAAEALEGA